MTQAVADWAAHHRLRSLTLASACSSQALPARVSECAMCQSRCSVWPYCSERGQAGGATSASRAEHAVSSGKELRRRNLQVRSGGAKFVDVQRGR